MSAPRWTPAVLARAARVAVSATLHCLTGCAIGEVLGMALAAWCGWGDASSIALAVVLAFAFGYGLTISALLRAGLSPRQAVGVAFAADTLSILTMEVIDNAVMLMMPARWRRGWRACSSGGSLAASLAVAFVVTVPVNRALITRGKVMRWCTHCTTTDPPVGRPAGRHVEPGLGHNSALGSHMGRRRSPKKGMGACAGMTCSPTSKRRARRYCWLSAMRRSRS